MKEAQRRKITNEREDKIKIRGRQIKDKRKESTNERSTQEESTNEGKRNQT